MKLLGLRVPFTKATDQNTITPIRPMYLLETAYGAVTEAFAGMWGSNLRVENTQSLLAFSAVFACVQLISQDIGKLPLRLQRLGKGEVWQDEDNPSYSPVLRAPNRYQTRNQFIVNWISSKLIWGNTYVLEQRSGANKVDALYILDPQRVSAMVAPDGSVFYKLNTDTLAGVETGGLIVAATEMMHDRAVCLFHPLCGVSPLYASAISTTQGLKIQHNSSRFFANMSRPSLHLSFVGQVDPEKAKLWKTDFEREFSGGNIGRLLITGGDAKLNQLTMPAEQSQLIEQLDWTGKDVARAFNVPLYKLGLEEMPSDIVAVNQDYYNQVLQPNIDAIEELFKTGLDLAKDLRVKFDTRELLRMDDKRRAERYELMTRAAVTTPNENRAAENLPPVEGGDTPYLQQQNFSLAALAKRDAQDDPFATTPKPTTPAKEPDVVPPPADDEEERMALLLTTELLKQGPAWLRQVA